MNRGNRYGLKTVTSWRRVGRLRLAGLAAGTVASLAMIVVGCSGVTQGTATVDAYAPEYRSSVSSRAASKESERQVAITQGAVRTSCDAFGSSSSDSVDAVNSYVNAFNEETPDAPALAGPAIDALNRSADLVAGSLSDPLESDLRTALNGWVDAARQLVGVLSRSEGPDTFNAAISALNDSKTAAGTACDAAY